MLLGLLGELDEWQLQVVGGECSEIWMMHSGCGSTKNSGRIIRTTVLTAESRRSRNDNSVSGRGLLGSSYTVQPAIATNRVKTVRSIDRTNGCSARRK